MPPLFTPCAAAGDAYTDLSGAPVNVVNQLVNADGSYGGPVDLSALYPTADMIILQASIDVQIVSITDIAILIDDGVDTQLKMEAEASSAATMTLDISGTFGPGSPPPFWQLINVTLALNWSFSITGLANSGGTPTFSIDVIGYWAP